MPQIISHFCAVCLENFSIAYVNSSLKQTKRSALFPENCSLPPCLGIQQLFMIALFIQVTCIVHFDLPICPVWPITEEDIVPVVGIGYCGRWFSRLL